MKVVSHEVQEACAFIQKCFGSSCGHRGAPCQNVTNLYSSPARPFVSGGDEISSDEGTTQGDPLSMLFYAPATLPLVTTLQVAHASVRQIWYANDSGAAGQSFICADGGLISKFRARSMVTTPIPTRPFFSSGPRWRRRRVAFSLALASGL